VTDLHSTNGTVLIRGESTSVCPAGRPVNAAVGTEIHAGDVLLQIEQTG